MDEKDDIGICISEAVIDFYRKQSPDGKLAAIDTRDLAKGLGRVTGLFMAGLPKSSFKKALREIESSALMTRAEASKNPIFPTVTVHETKQ